MGCCGQARRDRLGVLVAGLAEMRVKIDETRRDHDAIRADSFSVGARQPSDGFDDPLADDDVAWSLAPGRRINQPRAADLEIGHARSAVKPDPSRACPPAGRAAPSGPRRRW